ncbi:hypothetical protein GCM10022237_22480 [Nocardioides ginsengisoli]|uniref:Uncharacterized protein n=1 Tax=Nocardioides ginsengisoli TaxID=363868 RepID=A0ABW3VZF3_9ACTN
MSRHARITLTLGLGLLLVVPTATVSSATPARAVPLEAGTYAGRLISDGTAQEKATMKVTRDRKLAAFKVNLTVYCWNLDHIEVRVHPLAFPRTRTRRAG